MRKPSLKEYRKLGNELIGIREALTKNSIKLSEMRKLNKKRNSILEKMGISTTLEKEEEKQSKKPPTPPKPPMKALNALKKIETSLSGTITLAKAKKLLAPSKIVDNFKAELEEHEKERYDTVTKSFEETVVKLEEES